MGKLYTVIYLERFAIQCRSQHEKIENIFVLRCWYNYISCHKLPDVNNQIILHSILSEEVYSSYHTCYKQSAQ